MSAPNTKTVEQLKQELEQALTRAEAAEAELREARQDSARPKMVGAAQRMQLFHVQDCDRPLYVVARDWTEALAVWQWVIADENPGCDQEQPDGIQFVAGSNDLRLAPRDIDQVVR